MVHVGTVTRVMGTRVCRCVCGKCGAPAVVGFAGKRQWMELLNVGRKGRDKYTKLDHGMQHMRPEVRDRQKPQ